MAFVTGPALSTSRVSRASSTCTVRMVAEKPDDSVVSRRTLLASSLAAAAAALLPKSAFAEREYPYVGYLGGGEQIDVNNANVRAYAKLRGFYPNLAGLIASNGPYESVDDLLNIPGLTDGQKELISSNKERLIALPPAPEYVVDKINNGLYK